MKHEENEPVGKFRRRACYTGYYLSEVKTSNCHFADPLHSYNTRVAFASKVIRSFSCAQLSDSDACLVTMGTGSIRRTFDYRIM